MVEPVDPFEGSELHGLEGTPGAASMNEFRLVESVDGLRQSVVVGITDTPYGRLDAGGRQPFGVFDGKVLGRFNRSLQRFISRSCKWAHPNMVAVGEAFDRLLDRSAVRRQV